MDCMHPAEKSLHILFKLLMPEFFLNLTMLPISSSLDSCRFGQSHHSAKYTEKLSLLGKSESWKAGFEVQSLYTSLSVDA